MADETSGPVDVHARARANLFPGALPHNANWKPGRLEPRSYVAWSSQALCVGVWGAIAESDCCDAIVSEILAAARIEFVPPKRPKVVCEVRDRRDVLSEHGGSNPTCPDVLITWPDAVVAVESKFTEGLGGCSQVKPRQVKTPNGKVTRPPACSGNYEVGSDLGTKTDAACRLTITEGTRSSRLYWNVGAGVFRSDVVAPPRRPCPFRDGNYQLMRNICFAAQLAKLQDCRGRASCLHT